MFKITAGIILGILCVIFFVQNSETVTFVFLAWQITVSRALMLVIVLITGVVIGWIFSGMNHLKRRRK